MLECAGRKSPRGQLESICTGNRKDRLDKLSSDFVSWQASQEYWQKDADLRVKEIVEWQTQVVEWQRGVAKQLEVLSDAILSPELFRQKIEHQISEAAPEIIEGIVPDILRQAAPAVLSKELDLANKKWKNQHDSRCRELEDAVHTLQYEQAELTNLKDATPSTHGDLDSIAILQSKVDECKEKVDEYKGIEERLDSLKEQLMRHEVALEQASIVEAQDGEDINAAQVRVQLNKDSGRVDGDLPVSFPRNDEFQADGNAAAPKSGDRMSRGISDLFDADSIANENSYEFAPSVYDGLFFLFCKVHGKFPSWWLLMLVFASGVSQIFFTALVNRYYASSTFDQKTIDALRVWRLDVAHDLGRIDRISGVSLASRVCNPDAHATLDLSIQQAQYVQDLTYYLDRNTGYWFTIIVLFSWSSTIFIEMRNAFTLGRGVWYMPRSSSTTMVRDTEPQGNPRDVTVHSITKMRFSITLLAVAFRISFGFYLCIIGVMFLITAPSIYEQLLNAVALEFVITLDELYFEAFAPQRTKHLIRCARPLRIEASSATIGGLNLGTFVSLLLVIILVFLASLTLGLDEYMNRMHAMQELCPYLASDYNFFSITGNFHHEFKTRNTKADEFVYAVQSVGLPYWTETRPFTLDLQHSVHTTAIDEIIQDKLHGNFGAELNERRHFGVEFIEEDLNRVRKEAITLYHSFSFLYGNGSQGCNDLNRSDLTTTVGSGPGGKSYRYWLWGHISDIVGHAVQDCADVAFLCIDSFEKGTLVRNWCPATCACNDPNTSNPTVLSSEFGCPGQCPFHKDYVSKISSIPCNDTVPGDSRWGSFIELSHILMEKALQGLATQRTFWKSITSEMQLKGCGFIDTAGVLPWCDANTRESISYGLSLRFWCPVKCQCADRDGALNCPPKCFKNNATRLNSGGIAQRNALEVGFSRSR